MFNEEIEYLESFEVEELSHDNRHVTFTYEEPSMTEEVLSNVETAAKRRRCSPIKKWTVAEEKALVDFLMENKNIERPTAQTYYKRFAETTNLNIDWKLTRSKVRNMRTIYNKAKSWEGSTGEGSMNGETIKATLLKKCHFFYEFDELFTARITQNVVIEDTLDPSQSGDILNAAEIEIDENTTSSVGNESRQSVSRKGIYSRTGVSDIIELQTEMIKLKKEKIDKEMAFKGKEIEIKEKELALKEKEIQLKQNEIESKERVQILELQMKERLAMEEIKKKYNLNLPGN